MVGGTRKSFVIVIVIMLRISLCGRGCVRCETVILMRTQV